MDKSQEPSESEILQMSDKKGSKGKTPLGKRLGNMGFDAPTYSGGIDFPGSFGEKKPSTGASKTQKSNDTLTDKTTDKTVRGHQKDTIDHGALDPTPEIKTQLAQEQLEKKDQVYTKSHAIIDGPEALQGLFSDLLHCTKHQVSILSQTLDRAIFDTEQVKSAIFALTRRHLSTKVRILINSTEEASKRAHHLVDLYRKLPSNIEIRKVDTRFTKDLDGSYMILDQNRIIHIPDERETQARLEYAPSRLLVDSMNEFSTIWEKSRTATELKELNI